MSDENLIPGLDSTTGLTSSTTGSTLDLSSVLTGFQDAYNNALSQYSNIPGLASSVTGYNQIASAFNDVANQRAAQGILNGTEAQNLRADTLSGLASDQSDLTTELLNQRNSLLNLGLSNDSSWASNILSLLSSGYIG